jgi:class 3 adenylate cyclase/tetratricopeptide (TPR) repeat protein
MHCLSCGATLPKAARFCIDCGSEVTRVCRGCGVANPWRAAFCANCGATVGEARPEAYLAEDGDLPSVERRQLTVVFCDLVNSTAMTSRLDPEELREVVGAYHKCIADTVEPFGGFVARYMGDGALIYFGYPIAFEDSARRAVRAALALVANVADIDVLAERLHVRIGIATGLVVIGELVNAGAAREQTALGEAPNLAARLQAIAKPDSIVVAAATKRVAGSAFDYHDLGTAALHGFPEPVAAWQVLSEARPHRGFTARDSTSGAPIIFQHDTVAGPLIGREQELRLLLDCWQEVVEGRGRVVLVSGDPGIGKSSLAQAFLSHLGESPHAQLEVRSQANYANSPLYPVVAVLPTVLAWMRTDDIDAKLEKLKAFCARLHLPAGEALPLLASLLCLPAEQYVMPAMSPERQKAQTLQLLVTIVAGFAAEKPLTMLVEDLQWIDPTSRQMLQALIDRIPTAPLLLLLTTRLGHDPSWPPHSHVTRLTLTRLTRDETKKLIDHIVEGKQLPVQVANEIVATTDGVPLFVEELTRMVLESGLMEAREDRYALIGPLPPLAIPATLQDSLAARLDRLAAAKPLAQLCATLGREFSYPLLRAVAGMEDQALQKSLEQLVRAEFLQQRAASSEAIYTFKDALIQEAAYQSLLKRRRQLLHGRIARVIVEQFAIEAEAHPEVVALHHTRSGDLDAAVTWWQKASQYAFRRASYPEAIAHCLSGLRVLETLPDERRRAQLELGLQVDLGYSLIPIRGWGASETEHAFSRAAEVSEQIGDAPSQFRALWGVGAFHFVRGDQHKAIQFAEQCMTLARQANDLDARIEAHYLLGISRCVRGDFVRGSAELEACVHLYGKEVRETHRLLYGQDAKAAALGWLAMARWVLGDPDEALAKARDALLFVQDSTQPFLHVRALSAVGFVYVFRGEPRESDGELAAALALCVEQGFVYFHAVVTAFHGANLALLGRMDEAIELMKASLVALGDAGSLLLSTLILVNLAKAYLAIGCLEEAQSVLEEGFRTVERTGERWAESELHRLRGQLWHQRGSTSERVEVSFRKALEIARSQQAKSFELRAVVSLAACWQQLNKNAAAKALLLEVLGDWPKDLDSADLREARLLLARVC